MDSKIYQTVTDRIVAMMEAGTRPWARSWTTGGGFTVGGMQRPLRIGGQPYTGINVINLWAAAQARGFTSRHWMTFKGAKEIGASVRKGAKAELAFYVGAHVVTDTDKSGEETERTVNFLRFYYVFNADEIDNLPPRFQGAVAAPVESAEQRDAKADGFIAATGAMIAHGGDKAYYAPSSDSIRLPMFAAFDKPESYYATALHELVHWTSHTDRCARELGKRFGDDAYAAEELVAELGSAFLCADLGISAEPRPDHASYLAHWVRVMRADNKAIFKAAALADRAAGFLHKLQPAEPAPPAPEPIGGNVVAMPEPAPAELEPVAAPVADRIKYGPAKGHRVAKAARKRAPGFLSARKVSAALAAAEGARKGAASEPVKIRDYDSYVAARAEAVAACIADHGLSWKLAEGASVPCRLPAKWTACKVFGRVSRSPRDMRLPAAQYWPGGILPEGPEYFADYPRETGPIWYPNGHINADRKIAAMVRAMEQKHRETRGGAEIQEIIDRGRKAA